MVVWGWVSLYPKKCSGCPLNFGRTNTWQPQRNRPETTGLKQQTTEKLSYLLVGSNRRIMTAVGIQKGRILPKMGSASFSMFDSR
jgi:hypothetical protein